MAAAREEERDALESIYQDDFEARADPRDGQAIWRVVLHGLGATFVAKLPEGYPERDPPTPGLEFDDWPTGGDAFSARIGQELRSLWEPAEGCVFQWAEHVKEALASGPPELAGGAQSAGAAAGAAAAGADAEAAGGGPGVGVVPLDQAAATAVGPSLKAGGFADCGHGIYSHGSQGITVEVGEELTITVDGIDAEDLSDWAAMQLQANAAGFGDNLRLWVVAQRSEEPGFSEELEGEAGHGLDFLPSWEELSIDRSRPVLIYTWGKALRKAMPPDSQHNFNAGILNGRGGGADLRTMNGLSDEVQNNVASCGLFPRWITMVCHKVEHDGLHTISINCTKGRHRSVAAAEILKKLYYTQATCRHLTIY